MFASTVDRFRFFRYWARAGGWARANTKLYTLPKAVPPILAAFVQYLVFHQQTMQQFQITAAIVIGGYIVLYTLEFTWKCLFRAPVALDTERHGQVLQLTAKLEECKRGPEWIKDLAFLLKPTPAEPASETAIGATLQIKIPNGDVLIWNLKRSGSHVTGRAYVRIRSGFPQTAAVLIRMDGQEAVVSIAVATTGRFEDSTRPFALKLDKVRDVIEMYAIVTVGGKEYMSERHPVVIG
ncbi:MAG: hypothetical protein ACR2IV_04300 [Bryobacteraceae bacterium]